MSGHVIAAAEAAARLKLETYESTFEVEAPGTGRLGVAFRDSSELWTVTPGGALHRLGVYPGCLLLRANGRPCGATDGSALQALEAAAADGGEVRVLLFARPPPPQVPGECRAPRRSPPAELLRGDDGRGRRARTSRDSLDGEDCFIKTLRDHATALEARDLLREAAVLARLAPHPHVARLVAWSAPDSVPWAALARVPGQDLESYLKEESFVERVGAAPRWTLETALEVARHVASALAHCHSSAALGGPAVLHRDIKPANVVLEALPAITMPSAKQRSRFSFGDAPPLRFRATLVDFGLCAVLDDRRALTAHTGSPRYMAPENALSSSYSTPSDVYSAALVAWAACARRQPFRDLSTKEHAEKVIGGRLRPPPLADAPPELDDLLSRAWAPDPSSRPDAADFSDGLAEALVAVRFGE